MQFASISFLLYFISTVFALPLNINGGKYSPVIVVDDGKMTFSASMGTPAQALKSLGIFGKNPALANRLGDNPYAKLSPELTTLLRTQPRPPPPPRPKGIDNLDGKDQQSDLDFRPLP
ncbi:hypothetical protein HYFRA_00002596 [Hymenoscyphus fraxineus]|uniref:Uncharacterized protein n=1 Tax=Hymenoscyphus fraxineus TaxID=746836 RepID=A0A9N9PNN6_9HELO|nr:hypothetical protein HYFRA_00002596 [Hymenoscyphus fraxineus]